MKKRQSFVIAFIIILSVIFSGCSGTVARDLTVLKKGQTEYKAMGAAGTLKASDSEGFIKSTENEYLALYYSEDTAAVRVFDKRTGKWWLSNPEKAGNQGGASSQLAVSTVTLKGVVNEYSSHTDSVLKNQVEFKNGKTLKVIYTFGNVKPDLSGVPTKLTDERFKELQERAEKADADGRLLKRRYMQDKESGIWTRKELTADQSKKLKALFEKIEYTAAELEEDSKLAGDSEGTAKNESFVIPLEYILEDDSMVVRISGKDIVYPDSEIITSIKLLEYFGTLAENEEGYFFVPNGSGALIGTEKQSNASGSYELKLYGKDYTIPVEKENGTDRENLMPVFGISRKEDGVFAIIEENDAVASINISKAGNIDNWNTVSASFAMNAVENIGLSSDAISKFYTTSKVKYSGDTSVRYVFLTENNYTYNGMASVYRKYLDLNQKRKKLEGSDDIPLFIETVGSLEGQTSTMGIVHNQNVALTTFKDDIKILEDLDNSGISNVKLILSGWANKGVDQRFLNKLDIISSLGGKKDFDKLLSYAKEKKMQVYPDILLNTFSSKDELSIRNTYASVTLGSEKSKIYEYDKITGSPLEDSARYVVSPSFQMNISENLLKLLQKKNISSVLLSDIATTAFSDYNKKHEVLRQHSLLQSKEIVKKYADTLDGVMLSAPNMTTFAYSDLYTDVPESSGSHMSEMCSVPFYQMICHGYADYSFSALNFTSDYRTNFLKCIEYGGMLKYRFIYNEKAELSPDEEAEEYASRYSRWKKEVYESYKEANELLSPVRNAVMVSHTKLQGGVYKTDYDNGYSIYVNYNSNDVTADGISIPALQAVCRK